MALACIFVSIILGMAAAVPQDMSGKMLVFPEETNSAHVKLISSKQSLAAATVCMRYFTDLSRGTTFFSLATPSFDNAFLIDKPPTGNALNFYARNSESLFKGLSVQLNKWQSVCGTWDSASGLMQLWLDGKPSIMRISATTPITGPMSIILGQEQDKYEGGFDINQSFIGMISDVHMWDYVLSPRHIDNFNHKFNFPAGNVLNWGSIDFQTTGRVMVQNEQTRC